MLQLIGIILGMVFVIVCSVTVGITLASYFVNKNNNCYCQKEWKKIRK
jgi:high-affinity Fe2+/Pb2+ permease